MEETVNKVLIDYSNFLTHKVTTFKKNSNICAIISYVFEIDDSEVFDKSITYLDNSNTSFFFQNNLEEYRFCAFNSILSINENGKERYAKIEKRLKSNFPFVSSNLENYADENFPLFVGSMKFTVEHSDDVWKNFNDSDWFIPEFVVYEKESKVRVIYNCYYDSTFSSTVNQKKLRSYLMKLIEANGPSEYKLPQIRVINGNSPKEKKKWTHDINYIKDLISDNEIDKLVLSRKIEIVLAEKPTSFQIIKSLIEKQKNSFLFLFKNGSETFFGASPELLFTIKNKTLFTEALAGTAPISDNIEENKNLESILLSSEKEINEHKTVVDHIESVLNNFCSEVELSNDVGVKKFNTIQHIWTPIIGKLQSNYSIFQIVEKLFPTPAVCGAPKESALNYIKKIEEHKRGLYSGIVGWFNLNYNCEFSVAIRSGVISDKKLYAFAGCGIVEASKPETEFAETNLKFNTLLSLFK